MKKYNYDICIIGGCGHIGLPLGIAFADSGKRVVLYDIDQNALDTISSGKMPFIEKGAEKLLKAVLGKNLFLSSKKSVITKSYFLVIVIGTPIDNHLNPKVSLIRNLFSDLMDYIKDNQHIIIRSTIFLGATEMIRDILKTNNKQNKLSFCPERIAEGNALEELRTLPQIVASFDESASHEAKELFSVLTNDIIFLKPQEAELAKLFSNVWRYILFSISNQFYQIATQNNLDYYKIYDAVIYHYPRTENLPRAGFAAGPCLFKDTMQLASCSNNNFFLGHSAMLINEGLPNFIVQRLKNRFSLKDKIVGILGMAFKGNIDDSRESLSYKLKKILEIESKQVFCTDPFVKDKELVSLQETIMKSDILILGAPHTQYKLSKFDLSKKIVVDVWNFFGKGGFF
jgi:UDP-N-acetyl-D-mannosaminuronic acid dehydrogenase